MDCLTSSILLQKACSCKCMCFFNVGLSSLYDGWAKYKEKVPDVSDPNQNIETKCNPNSSLHNLKIYSSKGCRKTSQRWIICTYAQLTQQFSLSEFLAEDITSNYGFLLWLVNTFTIGTGEYYPRCYKVSFKNL